MPLRLLPPHIVNRIAAGEVVERPGSAVKELTENALDAGANRIDVTVWRSGRNFIRIQDNGKGMTAEELELCMLRHATSKLDDDDLWNIRFMGFRGEALASIASVSRMTVKSCKRGVSEGWEISCEGGGEQTLRPSACNEGTCVEVKDLFYATPARLKFLKSDRTEQSFIEEQLYRLSLAHPDVRFSLSDEKKTIFTLVPEGGSPEERRFARICAITDPAFKENSLKIDEEREDGYALKGYAGLPTFHRSSPHHLYLFVNGRPVRDKSLNSAIRAAYQDFLPRMRYPIAALFLTVPVEEVDVNVHPAKAEVRFRRDDIVRSLLVGGLRRALQQGAYRSSSAASMTILSKVERPPSPAYESPPRQLPLPNQPKGSTLPIQKRSAHPTAFDSLHAPLPTASPPETNMADGVSPTPSGFEEKTASWNVSFREKMEETNTAKTNESAPHPSSAVTSSDAERIASALQSATPPALSQQAYVSAPAHEASTIPAAAMPPSSPEARGVDLGFAKCVLFANYIVAQTEDALVIVDQHAAHERLRYERLKQEYRAGGVKAQSLLAPEVVDLSPEDFSLIEEFCPIFADAGLKMAPFGQNAVIVRAVPAILAPCDVRELTLSIIDDLRRYGSALKLQESVDEILSSVACKGAIKAGHTLHPEEMNALLRAMEVTPYSGQCNHGRPTYVKLKLKDVEKLFGRT